LGKNYRSIQAAAIGIYHSISNIALSPANQFVSAGDLRILPQQNYPIIISRN